MCHFRIKCLYKSHIPLTKPYLLSSTPLMLILETIVLSQMFVANELLAANKIWDIKKNNKLIEKSIELKIRKLLKF